MENLDVIKEHPLWKKIKVDYEYWYKFMADNITFTIDSKIHSYNHCARVLGYCLLMSEMSGLSRQDRRILCIASVFHDCRRQDDGYDVGHGARGAKAYMNYCVKNNIGEYPAAALLMTYHDIDDAVGEGKISTVSGDKVINLYRIFKDADGLDRLRFGDKALDERFLRTRYSKKLVEFAHRYSAVKIK